MAFSSRGPANGRERRPSPARVAPTSIDRRRNRGWGSSPRSTLADTDDRRPDLLRASGIVHREDEHPHDGGIHKGMAKDTAGFPTPPVSSRPAIPGPHAGPMADASDALVGGASCADAVTSRTRASVTCRIARLGIDCDKLREARGMPGGDRRRTEHRGGERQDRDRVEHGADPRPNQVIRAAQSPRAVGEVGSGQEIQRGRGQCRQRLAGGRLEGNADQTASRWPGPR